MRRIYIWILVSAAFTAAMVNYSARHGRLLVRPTYDDVGYFCDALRRLHLLDAIGPRGFIPDFFRNPPHSVWSTGLAMTSYVFLGLHDWAPYVANGVVVLGLLLAVDYLMAGAALLQRASATIVALSAPMTGVSITEFRPDCAAGLATAMGIVLLLRRSVGFGTFQRNLAAGALFAAALLIKPSVFPLTIALAGTAWVLHGVLAAWADGVPFRTTISWRTWGAVAAPILLLAGPFYILAARHIGTYVYEALWGSYHLTYAVSGSWRYQARYYLVGPGGILMLGRHLVLLTFLVICGWVETFLRRDRRGAAEWTSFGIMLLVAYLLPTTNQPKNPFIGAAFQFFLLFMGILALRQLLFASPASVPTFSPPPKSGLNRSRILCAVTIAASLGWMHWPVITQDIGDTPGDEKVVALNRLARSAYEAIADRMHDRQTVIYSTASCPADACTIAYLGQLDGHDVSFKTEVLTNDPAVHRRLLESADFVLASEPGNGLVYDWLGEDLIQQQTLDMIRSMPEFKLRATIPALHGKNFYVFGRKER